MPLWLFWQSFGKQNPVEMAQKHHVRPSMKIITTDFQTVFFSFAISCTKSCWLLIYEFLSFRLLGWILNPGGRTIKKKNVLQIFDGYLGTAWKTGGGGGGVWLSQNKIYLISPHPSRLCSLLMMIPPHWKTISYSPPFMLCQRRLIPTPFPVKTMQPPPAPRQKLGSWDTGKT